MLLYGGAILATSCWLSVRAAAGGDVSAAGWRLFQLPFGSCARLSAMAGRPPPPPLPPQPRGKAWPPSWPPWVHRTAETLNEGRAALPKSMSVPQGLTPPGPSSSSSEAPFTQRLTKDLLYRYSDEGVRFLGMRPERWTTYCLGRPVQVHVGSNAVCVCVRLCASAFPFRL